MADKIGESTEPWPTSMLTLNMVKFRAPLVENPIETTGSVQ